MSTVEQDWRKEQQRVDLVINEIDKQAASLTQHVSAIKTDIVEIRKNFWDDVTVNFDDPMEAVDTMASVKQQAEVLSERERSHRHANSQLKTLARLRQSPYFGRIDFREAGEKRTEQIYLGVASLLDETNEQFLVYDWRAPVSSLYYDSLPGPSRYETPGGTISGDVELKRQFIIRNGTIDSMFDTGFTIGDELLQEALGKRADNQMKSIVATIQKEQNQIIRNEMSQLIVVLGAAGSGKTSAALQRIAYLLYRYREVLRSEHILLFSPNPLFNSYVSTVLPELGEENMQQTTFMQYIEGRVGDAYATEDVFTQMEYVLSSLHEPEYSARIAAIRYKASLDYMQAIERYHAALGQSGMIFHDVSFRGRTLISAESIANQFYSLDTALSIPNRLQLLIPLLLRQLKEHARLERSMPWVEDEMELLDKDEYLEVYQALQRKNRYNGETFDDMAQEQKLLSTMIVQKHFKPLRAAVKTLRFVNIPAIYRALFADPQTIHSYAATNTLPPQWPDICRLTYRQLDQGVLAYEDATPYVYLKELIEGFQVKTSIRHVFIDEAQDYSPFQFAFIKRLFPYSKMTVLGDLNQLIYTHAAANSGFELLAELFGAEKSERFVLTRSYRSTLPIVQFTRQLVADGEAIEPFNRDGRKPTLTITTDAAEQVRQIAERIRLLEAAGHQTIAVICKTATESRELFEALRNDFPLHLIEKESGQFKTGILIIPAYLAKGVEFDAVIISDASKAKYGREEERKLFYTACTRAMHELHIICAGPMSPFIEAVTADSYEDGRS